MMYFDWNSCNKLVAFSASNNVFNIFFVKLSSIVVFLILPIVIQSVLILVWREFLGHGITLLFLWFLSIVFSRSVFSFSSDVINWVTTKLLIDFLQVRKCLITKRRSQARVSALVLSPCAAAGCWLHQLTSRECGVDRIAKFPCLLSGVCNFLTAIVGFTSTNILPITSVLGTQVWGLADSCLVGGGLVQLVQGRWDGERVRAV